ncbi:MAG: hypothetical protein ACR2K1_09480 [Saprospiraceae bacterium]
MSNATTACPRRLLRRLLLPALALLFVACENPAQKPLDAKTRRLVDSLAAAGIRQMRLETDSLCLEERTHRLPQITDSLKQRQRREIEAKMRATPR